MLNVSCYLRKVEYARIWLFLCQAIVGVVVEEAVDVTEIQGTLVTAAGEVEDGLLLTDGIMVEVETHVGLILGQGEEIPMIVGVVVPEEVKGKGSLIHIQRL